jgi:two-component system chemotaxis sensor kinase CheA
MDMSPYRDLFVSEARSHLAAFGELIVHLESSAEDSDAINELFRHAHSLKGMAATMGYEQIVAIAHLMEDQLGKVRSGEFRMKPALTDLLLDGSDTLTLLVSLVETGSAGHEDTSTLVKRLAEYDPAAEASPQSALGVPTGSDDTLEQPATHTFRQSDSLKSIRIKTETLDHLVNITGELITNRYRMAEAIRAADAAECREPLHQLTALLRTLRDEVFKARMLPFAFIAERFPRLVRDLARKQGKEVQFIIEGREIELDRTILEVMAEPIVHLLRNAIDHGLESADERVMAGKPFGSTVRLTVRRDRDHVEICVSDDGRGMDPERLKQKGIEKGLITPEHAATLTEHEAFQLVCAPGFSTATAITDISGRGVGMDAVRDAVHALAGVLSIQSQTGLGSSFIMRLPITVSIIHALIIQCGHFELALPLNVVTRTLELKPSDIGAEGGRATICLDDTMVPLRRLRQALQLPEHPDKTEAIQPVVVCDVGGTPRAFAVDRILGQQEIFVRPLRAPLAYLPGLSGATITGDGRVIFIADVNVLA